MNTMKNAKVMTTSKEFVGAELEIAYAKLVDGCVNGGFSDGGKDVVANDPSIPAFQVKSSVRGAVEFLARSVRFKRYIPICIGEPPKTRNELINSLLARGCWVGNEIPGREAALKGIEQARRLCGT